MTTHKRCTNCDKPKPIESFRLRKKKGRPGLTARVATCDDCEARKNPDSYWQKPAPLWTQPEPYRPDAKNKNVRLFRRELARRGIAREV